MLNKKIISETNQQTITQLFNNRSRRYPLGQILIFTDDIVNQLGYIKSGYVKVYNISENGSTHIVFILTPGMVFPVFTLLALRHVPCRYFYETMTEVEANLAPLNELKQNLSTSKIDTLAELNYVGQNMLADTVDILSTPRAENRIRRLLFTLTDWLKGDEINNDLVALSIKLTHQDIANMSSLTRETTSAIIQKLKNEKLIYYKDHRLVISRQILRRSH